MVKTKQPAQERTPDGRQREIETPENEVRAGGGSQRSIKNFSLVPALLMTIRELDEISSEMVKKLRTIEEKRARAKVMLIDIRKGIESTSIEKFSAGKKAIDEKKKREEELREDNEENLRLVKEELEAMKED